MLRGLSLESCQEQFRVELKKFPRGRRRNIQLGPDRVTTLAFSSTCEQALNEMSPS